MVLDFQMGNVIYSMGMTRKSSKWIGVAFFIGGALVMADAGSGVGVLVSLAIAFALSFSDDANIETHEEHGWFQH